MSTFRPSPEELRQETESVAERVEADQPAVHETTEELGAKEKLLANLDSVQPCGANQDPRPHPAHSGECSWCHKIHHIERSPAAVAAVTNLHGQLAQKNGAVGRNAAEAKGKMI